MKVFSKLRGYLARLTRGKKEKQVRQNKIVKVRASEGHQPAYTRKYVKPQGRKEGFRMKIIYAVVTPTNGAILYKSKYKIKAERFIKNQSPLDGLFIKGYPV